MTRPMHMSLFEPQAYDCPPGPGYRLRYLCGVSQDVSRLDPCRADGPTQDPTPAQRDRHTARKNRNPKDETV